MLMHEIIKYTLISHSHLAHRYCQHVLEGNSVVGPSLILDVGFDTQPSHPDMGHCSVVNKFVEPHLDAIVIIIALTSFTA